MSKGAFFLTAGILLLLVVFLWLMTLVVNVQREELARPTPTPSPVPSPTPIRDARPTARPTAVLETPLALVESTPADGATNVPLDTTIVATFNQRLSYDDVIFAIQPDIRYRLRTNGTILTVEFLEPLLPETEYTYSINTLQQLRRVFVFTTAPAFAPTPPPASPEALVN
ncbi:MAG: Ig-like domain-containing protein [Patescibacteria group bacterium]|nr:Ig-like domain-containing protein [Patescibacteria group bacterium]